MAFTIFYAWQSDLPSNLYRSFIGNALQAAIKQIKNEVSDAADLKMENADAVTASDDVVDPDAEPDDADVVIQSGARGVSGAVNIGDTIMNRIAQAGIFVGDVSFVTTFSTHDRRPKRMPNANVLMELGAATQAGQRWDRIVLVMNEATGKVDELPFDLKHRQCEITYDLSDPNDPEKPKKKQQLIKRFVETLRPKYKEHVKKVISDRLRISAETRSEGEKVLHAARDKFEAALLDNSYRNLKSSYATLAVTIRPARKLEKKITKYEPNDLINFFQQMGGGNISFDHMSSAVIMRAVRDIPAESISVMDYDGTCYLVRNLVYGRDENRIPGFEEARIEKGKPYLIYFRTYQQQMMSAIIRILKGYDKMKIGGPWLIAISLLKMKDAIVAVDQMGLWGRSQSHAMKEDHVQCEPVFVEADAALTEETMDLIFEPALRTMWRGFGFDVYFTVGRDGNFVTHE